MIFYISYPKIMEKRDKLPDLRYLFAKVKKGRTVEEITLH